ncbi:DNA mismatch endonuclease (patch repair protein) [Sphingopyxis sp. OAS728]|uniref:very short patch repair endonuclease n=1 Tax=Sphingopyxis sp. OAS728 TaxID=2663823 RepID=UPI001789AF8C|nr:DNA mismatch endonuclease Vsr [Sphingopyxis sp. OAS728]MBE1527469.1 DNA mismatch endonuclease (patch repair protein) [Sphingopyxis sp. OAS728]
MDKISRDARTANMRAIKSRDTKPEIIVRRLAHRLGYRFRLHRKDLPGKPDLVFVARRKAIFVHGCFWHQHPDDRCLDGRLPRTRLEYWEPKLTRNQERDTEAVRQLENLGWSVLIIWECETKDLHELETRLKEFLERPIDHRT